MALTDKNKVSVEIDVQSDKARSDLAQFARALNDTFKVGLQGTIPHIEAARAAFGRFDDARSKGASGLLGLVQVGDKAALAMGGLSIGFDIAQKAALATVAAVAAVGVGLALATQKAISFGSQLNDLSQKTNLSTETLSALKIGAEQASSSLEEISGSIVIFNRRLIDARAGSKEAADAFRRLGINIQQDANAAFKEAFERLGNMEEGAERTALAIEIFGRSGASLIPVIEQMNGSIDDTIAKYSKLGLVMDKETAKAADDLGDQIDDLKLAFEGAALQIGIGLIPQITELVKNLNEAYTAVRDFSGGIVSLQSFGASILPTIELMTSQFGALGSAIQGAANSFRLFQAVRAIADRPGSEDTAGGVDFPFSEFGRDNVPGKPGKPGKGTAGKKSKEDITESELQIRLLRTEQDEAQRGLNGTREAAQRLLDVTERLIDAQRRQAETLLPRERKAKFAELLQSQLEAVKKYNDEVQKITEKEGKDIEELVEKTINATAKQIKELEDLIADSIRAQLQAESELLTARLQRRALDADSLDASATQLARSGGSSLRVAERRARAVAIREDIDFEAQMFRLRRERKEAELRGELSLVQQLNALMEAEQRRHVVAMAEIGRELQSATEKLYPTSIRSLFGDNFANLKEAGASNFQALATIAHDSFAQMSADAGNFATIAGGAVGAFTQGLGEMFAALILGGETGPAALRKLTAAVLAQVAQQAAVKSIFELAAGFAALFFNPAEAAAHFTAAALYGSVAAIAGVGARLIAPASAASDAAGSGGSSNARQSGGPRIINQSTTPQPVQIILRVEEGIVAQKVVNNYASNGTLRQIIRNDVGANDR